MEKTFKGEGVVWDLFFLDTHWMILNLKFEQFLQMHSERVASLRGFERRKEINLAGKS